MGCEVYDRAECHWRIAVVGEKVAATGADEVHFDEIDAPAVELRDLRADVGRRCGLGEVNVVSATVRTAGLGCVGDVREVGRGALNLRVLLEQLRSDAGVEVDTEEQAVLVHPVGHARPFRWGRR